MQRVVIFEGPDGTGKTEISEAYSKLMGIPRFQIGDDHKHLFQDDVGWFRNCTRYFYGYLPALLSATNQSMIFDRAFPSEYVYSPLLSREWSAEEVADVDQLWANIGAKIIFCYRDDYSGVSDYIGIKEIINAAHDRYMKFSALTMCETFMLDTSDENLNTQLDKIKEFVR